MHNFQMYIFVWQNARSEPDVSYNFLINIAQQRSVEIDQTFTHRSEFLRRRPLLHSIHILQMTIVPSLCDVRRNDDESDNDDGDRDNKDEICDEKVHPVQSWPTRYLQLDRDTRLHRCKTWQRTYVLFIKQQVHWCMNIYVHFYIVTVGEHFN